jgi:hypothetical protein
MSEWRNLKISAAALSAQVNRIQFDWSEAGVDESEQDDGDDVGRFDGKKEAGGAVEHAGEETPAGDAV